MEVNTDRPHAVVGKNIASLRKILGMTQEALAQKANVSISGLRDIERGIAEGHIDTRMRLAGALECNLYDFYKDPNRPSEQKERSFRDAATFLGTFVSLPLAHQKAVLAIVFRNPFLASDLSPRAGHQLQALLKAL